MGRDSRYLCHTFITAINTSLFISERIQIVCFILGALNQSLSLLFTPNWFTPGTYEKPAIVLIASLYLRVSSLSIYHPSVNRMFIVTS